MKSYLRPESHEIGAFRPCNRLGTWERRPAKISAVNHISRSNILIHKIFCSSFRQVSSLAVRWVRKRQLWSVIVDESRDRVDGTIEAICGSEFQGDEIAGYLSPPPAFPGRRETPPRRTDRNHDRRVRAHGRRS